MKPGSGRKGHWNISGRPLARALGRYGTIAMTPFTCLARSARIGGWCRHHHAGGQQRSHERAFERDRHAGSPGAHAVLLCDGAGWHQHGDKLTVPDNITLLPLPAYSPELNPMENVWDYLRGNKLSHTVWDTYEAIVEACANAWRFLIDDPDRIRSIAHRDWAWVNL